MIQCIYITIYKIIHTVFGHISFAFVYHDTDMYCVCVSQFLQACGFKPRMTSPEKERSFTCSVSGTEIQSKTHTPFPFLTFMFYV